MSARESVEEFLARGGAIRQADPGRATNHDPHFGKAVARIKRAADPDWKPKKRKRSRRRKGVPANIARA